MVADIDLCSWIAGMLRQAQHTPTTDLKRGFDLNDRAWGLLRRDKIRLGIDRFGPEAQLEMQLRLRHVARCTGIGDDLSLFFVLTWLNRHRLGIRVGRDKGGRRCY